MERPLPPPALAFDGRLWSSEELGATAASWLDCLQASLPDHAPLTALPLANDPEAIALFFALSCLPLPIVVLPADPTAWRTSPPVPAGTALFLPPSLGRLAAAGRSLGLSTVVVPAPRPGARPMPPAPFLASPGVVNFTSGSTGPPKPVYIRTRSLIVQAEAIIAACHLSAGAPVAASLPLATSYGLVRALILPTVLGSSPLGLLARFDHRALLRLFGSGPYAYWAGIPMMASVLARAPLPGPPPAVPPICHISTGRVSAWVFRAFLERFGTPLRPNYGQTENGFITADTAPADQVRPDCVGRPSPGIEVRIGDDPLDPYPPGRPGRVWFSSPWYMEGYGFPPSLAPREGRQGWWATRDLGLLDAAGYLTLAGRADDCFKTSSGYLVNPADIGQALASHPGVTEVVILPVANPDGPAIGALVEGDRAVDPAELRATAARMLPPWSRPQVLAVTDRLPRLAGGKADRAGCRAVLEDVHGQGGVD